MATFHPCCTHFCVFFKCTFLGSICFLKHCLNECYAVLAFCSGGNNYTWPIPVRILIISLWHFAGAQSKSWHTSSDTGPSHRSDAKKTSHYFSLCQIYVNKVLSCQHLFWLSFHVRGLSVILHSISDLISKGFISLISALPLSLTHTSSDTHTRALCSFSCSYIWFFPNSCSHDLKISPVHGDIHTQILPQLLQHILDLFITWFAWRKIFFIQKLSWKAP